MRRAGRVMCGGLAIALLAGCGGTRVSDEAIQKAAGVGRAPAATGTGTVPEAGTGTDSAALPSATAPDPSVATASAPVAGRAVAPVAAASAAPTTRAGKTATDKQGRTPASAPPASAGVGATATTGAATKSVIRVGVAGTFSGPVGSLVTDTATGIRVWSRWINSHGGVNGHPVEVLVGDDGGDPARFNSIVQQFVEEKHVLAFLYTTLGMAPNGNNKYLDAHQIFTMGTEGGLDQTYRDPYVLTATPSGHVNADSILFALAKVGPPQGKVKFAEFACSDFGLCDNFDQEWSNPAKLKQAGFEFTVRGRPSLTQPDYTSQCLAAKQAGAQVVMLALDTASLRRFAGNCARQNYHPLFGTADLLALTSLPADPNVDGLIVATKMAPWTDTRVPGIATLHKAFDAYLPGAGVSGGNSNGWILGQFFAAAGANLPDNPTPADITAGLYRIKHNDLQGMTYPITMTPGKPMARQLCYGVVVVRHGQYETYPGPSLYCEKDDTP